MSSVQEIEDAIVTLSLREQEDLYAWMDERITRAADVKLEKAVANGVFDEMIEQAVADYKAGNTQPL